jgi:hypothetical protein
MNKKEQENGNIFKNKPIYIYIQIYRYLNTYDNVMPKKINLYIIICIHTYIHTYIIIYVFAYTYIYIYMQLGEYKLLYKHITIFKYLYGFCICARLDTYLYINSNA